MKKLISLMLIFLIIFTGCTNDSDESKKTTEDNLQSDNHVIKMACTPPDTLNPLMTNHQSVYDVLLLVYDGLFSVDSDLTPQGRLAKSYTQSNENTTYTITLKDNVKFHSGKSFTSEDVIATLDYITFYSQRYSYLKSLIKSYSSTDSKTVVIQLNKSVSDFVNLLDFPVLPSGLIGEEFKSENSTFVPDGTGMYKYDSMENRKNIYLVANKDWFYNGKGPKIGKVNVEIMSDEETIIYAFSSSQIDILTTSLKGRDKVNLLSDNYQSYKTEENNFAYIGINTLSEALNTKEARQKLSSIIDKEKIIKDIHSGSAIKSHSPFRENIYYSDKTTYEMEENETINGGVLNENAPSGENTLVLLYNKDNKIHEQIALFIKHDLETSNYKVELSSQSKDTYVERVINCHYDIYIGEVNVPNNFDISFMFKDEDSYSNICTFSSDELSILCDNLNRMVDSESKKIALGNFNRYYKENAFQIPLYFMEAKAFVNKSIKGKLSPNLTSLLNGFENLYI